MVKVSQLAKERDRALSPLKERVLRFLDAHPDEVFSYRDEQLWRELGVKASALSFTLWSLEREGLIEKQKVSGKMYFGTPAAVADVRRRLGLTKEDPLDRARALRDRIWARTGDIDVVELLDSVRGSWD